jgi:hypothetical protein
MSAVTAKTNNAGTTIHVSSYWHYKNAGITEHVSSYCHDEKCLYYKTRQQLLPRQTVPVLRYMLAATVITKCRITEHVSNYCHDEKCFYYKTRQQLLP